LLANAEWKECIAFIVPKEHVKNVKVFLERRGKMHPTARITQSNREGYFLLPTTLFTTSVHTQDGEAEEGNLTVVQEEANQLVKDYGNNSGIQTTAYTLSTSVAGTPSGQSDRIIRIFDQWAQTHLSSDYQDSTLDALRSSLPRTYTIYGTLLLFSGRSFSDDEWRDLFQNISREAHVAFFSEIAALHKVTHIAINAPIPLHTTKTAADENHDNENLLRSPSNLQPLLGNFGALCSDPAPSATDFASAHWVTARQNAISQTWAPLYTMFSRGNISEKSRLLSLPSITSTVSAGPSCAVDLYAGIGYFTFSYAAAGVSKILAWDLNPWSIEGLHRGANANGWSNIYCGRDQTSKTWSSFCDKAASAKIVAFCESNLCAPDRIKDLRKNVSLPPIRHVNLGLLPSSVESWPVAASVLDRTGVGWVHVHMNFAAEEVEQKAEWCSGQFKRVLIRTGWSEGVVVVVEEIHRVKTYAPGVWHCVVDLRIAPAVKVKVAE